MKSPAFRFYAADWLASQRVQMMTLEEEGAYIRLLCYCWQHGSIPADPEKAARLVNKGASTTVITTVISMFQPNPNNPSQLVHDRMEIEREKQRVWSEKSAAGGKKSASSRLGTSENETVRVVKKCLQPNGNIPLSFPSSSSSSFPLSPSDTPTIVGGVGENKKDRNQIPPPIEAWHAYAQELKPPLPLVEADRSFDFYTSKGWKIGKSAMKDWQASLRNWHRGWQEKTNGTLLPSRHPSPIAASIQIDKLKAEREKFSGFVSGDSEYAKEENARRKAGLANIDAQIATLKPIAEGSAHV